MKEKLIKRENFALSILTWCLGAALLIFHIPWALVFDGSTVTGGDVPGHLYLIRSLQEALFEHHSIAHYGFGFWCGFPLFRFYFPFPYVVGATFANFTDLSTAFKLMTVIPFLLAPISFGFFAYRVKGSLLIQAAASLLGVSWFFTTAHVMWGANALSTISGMVAQAWAMPLAVIAISELLSAREKMRVRLMAVLFGSLAALSHFYGAVFLAIFVTISFLIDVASVAFCRKLIRRTLGFYLNIVMIGLAVSWWYLPLVLNLSESSDFGGHWNVAVLETFTFGEKIIFSLVIFRSVYLLFRRDKFSAMIGPFLLFVICGLLVFFISHFASFTAFNNIRFWPILYLSLYLLTILILVSTEDYSKPIFVSVVLGMLLFLAPTLESFRTSRSWLQWNFSGVESKEGGKDFVELIKVLKELPLARISAESNDAHNFLFGSVRVFELIPALTDHEFVEGAIVNSARFPGIQYFLQCLTSQSCAGWPPGSLMPAFDSERAVSMMKALGVTYHIGNNKTFDWSSINSTKVQRLFKGEFISLYKVGDGSWPVEVFDRNLPVLLAIDPRSVILHLPRWDLFRENPLVVVTPDRISKEERLGLITPRQFFSVALNDWREGARVKDRGFEDRYLQSSGSYLFGDLKGGTIVPNFFIADRPFDPELISSSEKKDLQVELGLNLNESVASEREIFRNKNITKECSPKLKRGFDRLTLQTSCIGKPHLVKYSDSASWHSDLEIELGPNGFMVVTPQSEETIMFWK